MPPQNFRGAPIARLAAGHWSLLLVLAVYLALRLPVLEADVPSFERLTYQTLDEMYYALVAHEWHQAPLRAYENLPFNLAQNLIVLAATTLGGWSYATLRMGSLMAGALGLLFVYLAYIRSCPQDIADRPLARNLVFAGAALALVTSVAFHYATIVLEPSISVSLYTAAVLLALSSRQPNPWVVGAVVASGPVLFYPYTLAYMAGAGVAVLVWLRMRPLPVLKAAGGAALLLAVLLCGFVALYPMSPEEFVGVVGAFGQNRVLNLSNYPWAYLLQKYVEMFPRTNLFRYSPLLLPVVLGAVLVLLGQVARQRRLPSPVVLAALGMLGARLLLLFVEKTHYERKASDMALLLLFVVLVAAGLLYSGIARRLRERSGPARAATVATAIVLLPLVAVAGNNWGALKPEIASASYHNRDTLLRLGRRLEHCTAVGEWGIGLAVYGQFRTTVNLYRYTATIPPSTDKYNALLRERLRQPDAVVISTIPPSAAMSADVREMVVPVYRFEFRRGNAEPSDFAIYVVKDILASGRPRSVCHTALLITS